MRGSHSDRRALLLDLDGTVADTLPVLRAAYHEFATSLGGEPAPGEFDRCSGVPIPVVVRDLVWRLRPAGDPADLLDHYLALVDRHYLGAAPMDGAAALLVAAEQEGWQRGIVTSGTRARAAQWLERAGLLDLVDVLVTAEDVGCPKPDPEPFALGLSVLGATPSASVAVDDTDIGIRSAIDAGIGRVYVLAPSGRFTPNMPGAAVPVSSLWELHGLLETGGGAPGSSVAGPRGRKGSPGDQRPVERCAPGDVAARPAPHHDR